MSKSSLVSKEVVSTKKMSTITITTEMLDKINQIEYSEEVEKSKKLKPADNTLSLLIYNIFQKCNNVCSNGYVIRQMQELFDKKIYHSQVILVRKHYIDIQEVK